MENKDIAKYVVGNRKQYFRNPILVKHETGKVKKSCFDLPPEDFVFGKKNKQDKVGAGGTVLDWQHAKLSPDKLARKDFIRLNKKSLKKGIHDNKTLNKFRKTNDLRVKRKNKVGMRPKLPSDGDNTHVYGIKGVKRTNAGDLINSVYDSEWRRKKDTHYQRKINKIQREKKRRKKMEKKNMYSKKRLHEKKYDEEEETKLFKMKKFRKVTSVLKTQGSPKLRNSHDKYGLGILRK